MRIVALFAVFGCINGCPMTCCSQSPPKPAVTTSNQPDLTEKK